MSPVSYLLVAVACGLTAAQRSAHVAPTLEERAAMRRGPCQVGWTLSDERCFRLAPAAAAWPEASRLCSELRPAARLASAVTSADQLLVRALWREAVRTQPAARREESALWVNPAAARVRTVERTKAALRGGYGALMSAQTLYTAPEAISDESSVIVDAGAESLESLESPESVERECPSLAAAEASTRQAGYSCSQQLLYVCELDTVDLNATEV